MNAAGTTAIPGDGRYAAPDWIQSPLFDLTFLILSPLAGLALMFAAPVAGPGLTLAAAALVGGPHYLASYSFYFWDDTAQYHRRRWVAYFIIPVLIAGFVGLVVLFRVPVVIVVLIYFWNAYHVSRQSCGILSIYRHRAGVFDSRQKSVNNAAIITTNLAMALAHTDWYPSLHRFLSIPSPSFPLVLSQVVMVAAAISLVRLAVSMFYRYRGGNAPRPAELSFLVSSLLLFHPYLWVRDADLATLGMLLGHFIQYLGIVWLLNSRKLATGQGSSAQRRLSRLWRDPKVLLPAFLIAGLVFLVLQLQAMAISITLVLLHFYLDGLFWAFNRPEVRNSMGPYLSGGGAGPGIGRRPLNP